MGRESEKSRDMLTREREDRSVEFQSARVTMGARRRRSTRPRHCLKKSAADLEPFPSESLWTVLEGEVPERRKLHDELQHLRPVEHALPRFEDDGQFPHDVPAARRKPSSNPAQRLSPIDEEKAEQLVVDQCSEEGRSEGKAEKVSTTKVRCRFGGGEVSKDDGD